MDSAQEGGECWGSRYEVTGELSPQKRITSSPGRPWGKGSKQREQLEQKQRGVNLSGLYGRPGVCGRPGIQRHELSHGGLCMPQVRLDFYWYI